MGQNKCRSIFVSSEKDSIQLREFCQNTDGLESPVSGRSNRKIEPHGVWRYVLTCYTEFLKTKARWWLSSAPITFVLLLLAACGPSDLQIQTAIAKTQLAAVTIALAASSTQRPTDTPSVVPTATPTPSITPSPTPLPTNTPTARPTATSTSTNTATATPLPPLTQTAQVIAVTKTKAAQNATATREAAVARKTATAVAVSRHATQIAQYTRMDSRELVSYANQHIGEKVAVRGRVFNVVSNTALQLYFAGTYDAFYAKTAVGFTGVYENNTLTIYGVVGGEECFKNSYGAEVCQPLIKDAFFEK